MPLLMPDDRLHQLEERAELFTVYGDRDALTGDDVAELVAELRATRAQVAHLVALHTRQRERAGVLGRPR